MPADASDFGTERNRTMLCQDFLKYLALAGIVSKKLYDFLNLNDTLAFDRKIVNVNIGRIDWTLRFDLVLVSIFHGSPIVLCI